MTNERKDEGVFDESDLRSGSELAKYIVAFLMRQIRHPEGWIDPEKSDEERNRALGAELHSSLDKSYIESLASEIDKASEIARKIFEANGIEPDTNFLSRSALKSLSPDVLNAYRIRDGVLALTARPRDERSLAAAGKVSMPRDEGINAMHLVEAIALGRALALYEVDRRCGELVNERLAQLDVIRGLNETKKIPQDLIASVHSWAAGQKFKKKDDLYAALAERFNISSRRARTIMENKKPK